MKPVALLRKHFSASVFLVIALALFLTAASIPEAGAATASMAWVAPATYSDGTPLTSIGGYKLYLGTSSGNYSQNIDVGNVTSYTVSSLSDGTTYYLAVTAYDTSGNTSGFSNEVTYTTTSTSSATYTVTVSAGAGGSITPSGSLIVSQGATQSFTITPGAGYTIAGVTVDGASIGAVSGYTFSNIAANHTIAASFTSSTAAGLPAVNSSGPQYTDSTGLVYSADTYYSGGTAASTTAAISGTSDPTLYQTERYGNFSYNLPVANGNYQVTLKFAEIYWSAPGQRVFSVSINGQTVISNLDIYAMVGKNAAYDVTIPVSVTNGTIGITFTSQIDYAKVSAIRMAAATSTASSFSINASAGTGGSISPSGTVTVASGASQSFTITPAAGYKIADVAVDGVSIGAVSTYAFSNVSANHTISATFAANASYTISATAGTGGKISPAGSVAVTPSSNQSFTIIPNNGYRISAVTVDGVSVGAISSYTFTNVQTNHAIAATFAKKSGK